MMDFSHIGLPCAEKKVSICDSQITSIHCSEDHVRFVFRNGFYILNEGTLDRTGEAYVDFGECSAVEFSCCIFQREASPSGAILHGQPCSLADLSYLVSAQKISIEIFAELYDCNYLHWRGALIPYKKDGLSDLVVIEIGGAYPVAYSWCSR